MKRNKNNQENITIIITSKKSKENKETLEEEKLHVNPRKSAKN